MLPRPWATPISKANECPPVRTHLTCSSSKGGFEWSTCNNWMLIGILWIHAEFQSPKKSQSVRTQLSLICVFFFCPWSLNLHFPLHRVTGIQPRNVYSLTFPHLVTIWYPNFERYKQLNVRSSKWIASTAKIPSSTVFRQKFAIFTQPWSDRFEGSYSCWSHRSKIGLGKRPEIFPGVATELEVETAGREDRTQAVECYRGNTMPSSVDHHIHLVRAHYLMIFSFKLSGSSLSQISCWLWVSDGVETVNWHDVLVFFFQGCWGEVASYERFESEIPISHHGPSPTLGNMLKLRGQGESKKCGFWAYMAGDWCFAQRTGIEWVDWCWCFLQGMYEICLFYKKCYEDSPLCSLCR